MKYQVQWRYQSDGLGPWDAGDVVELDEETAQFVLRDSPGALAPWSERQDRQLRRPKFHREVHDETFPR